MTISVLVYPNITFQKNLEADSYVVVMADVIRSLAAVRDDIEWTILTPERVEAFDQPNVHQVGIELPTYPNTMRTHFNAIQIKTALRWKERSYDVVYSHLPEHTRQLKNLLYNATNERPAFVGYCHWFEVPENTEYTETMLEVNLLGIREMQTCGVNSAWLRDLALHRAAATFNDAALADLSDTLTVHRLGRTPSPKVEAQLRTDPAYIAFNHRPNKYTGWRPLLDALDGLWERRQDWRLMTTLAPAERDYIEKVDAPTRSDYLTELARCTAGIGNFKDYSAWSIAATDGFGVGVPYVLPNDYCYPEMVGADYPYLFENDDEMVSMIERLIDHPSERAAASKHVRAIADDLNWVNNIDPYSEMLDAAVASLKPVGDRAKRYDDIVAHVDRVGSISKADLLKFMGWGVSIPWTPYRARLRADGYTLTRDTISKRRS